MVNFCPLPHAVSERENKKLLLLTVSCFSRVSGGPCRSMDIRHFPFAHIDNFIACLNGYPAESVHPPRHAGENAAERSRSRNGFRVETGRYAKEGLCLLTGICGK